MNIKRTILCTMLILLIPLCVVACSKNNEPNEKQILYDFKELDIEELADDYIINSVTIDRLKIDEDIANYWCTLTIGNDMYDAIANIEVEYEYYEKGGWIIKDVIDFDIIKYIAKTGYSERQAAADLHQANLELVEHQTDLKAGKDCISFRYTDRKKMYDQTGIIVCRYSFDSRYGWVEESTEKKDVSVSIHPTGVWSESKLGGNWVRAICFENYTDSTITLADYFIDTLDYDYVVFYDTYDIYINADGNVDFGGFVLTEDGVISDNGREMGTSTIVERLGNYTFTGGLYYSSYSGDTSSAVAIPELLGIPFGEAVHKVSSLGLRYEKGGQGTIVTNVVIPGGYQINNGTRVAQGSTLFLFCGE